MADGSPAFSVSLKHIDELVAEYTRYNKPSKEFDLGLEQMAELEAKIQYSTERLASNKLRGGKLLKAKTQLEFFQDSLAKLKASHEEGAKVLRKKALGFAALPREMRDAIFENIYVQEEPIEVSWKQYGDHVVFSSVPDEALYMSSLHVGPQLAQEAAEMFYTKNSFFFRACGDLGGYQHGRNILAGWSEERIKAWFDLDYYGSGVKPKECIRNLHVHIPHLGSPWGMVGDEDPRSRDSCKFEALYNDADHGDSWRSRLAMVSQYPTIRHVQVFQFQHQGHLSLVLRILNPLVRELRDAGKRITFSHPIVDSIFAVPLDGQCATMESPSFQDDPSRDIWETWKSLRSARIWDPDAVSLYEVGTDPELFSKGIDAADARLRALRSMLEDHYEIYKLMQRQQKEISMLDRWKEELESMPPEERWLRRQVYGKMLEHGV